MSWIQTRTGQRFDFAGPWKFRIEDIASSLANLCRFNGHCNEFYSVAQHSVLLARYALRHVGPAAAKYALLHDAAEAYVGDVSAPLKSFIGDDRLSTLERDITGRILWQFGAEPWPQVDEFDKRILLNERDALFDTPPPARWVCDDLDRLDGVLIIPWHHTTAKTAFLGTYEQLWKNCKD